MTDKLATNYATKMCFAVYITNYGIADNELSSKATSCIIIICHYSVTTWLKAIQQRMTCHLFLRMCPRATEHNVYSCYLMSCLVNVPLSSVRSRRLRCARLCLREGSAYTSFLRIHTQGSSRQSKLWGEQQHTQSVFNCRETTNKHTYSSPLARCLSHTNAQGLFTASSHRLNPNYLIARVAGNGGLGQIQPAGIPLIQTC